MFLFFGLVAAFDGAVRRAAPETVAEKMGLPVLARLPVDRGASRPRQLAGGRPDRARGLALRLRQIVTDPGSIILFTPSSDGEEAQQLVCDVSRYYALRDERVLILDARIAETPSESPLAGMLPVTSVKVEGGRFNAQGTPAPENGNGVGSSLVKYFLYECDEPADLIVPTPVPAVDYMPAGGPYPTTDVFATYRMKELVEAIRKQYSMILMVGPSLSHGTDVEILASYVNAIVVVLNKGAKTTPGVAESLQSLKEAKAPLMGSVIYT
jgi:Mrp family chromosome partitioning ATPase